MKLTPDRKVMIADLHPNQVDNERAIQSSRRPRMCAFSHQREPHVQFALFISSVCAPVSAAVVCVTELGSKILVLDLKGAAAKKKKNLLPT